MRHRHRRTNLHVDEDARLAELPKIETIHAPVTAMRAISPSIATQNEPGLHNQQQPSHVGGPAASVSHRESLRPV